MKNEPPKKQLWVEAIIQIIALIALITLFYLDKYQHEIIPPVNDLWYAILLGLSVWGRGVILIIETFIKKK